MTRTFSIDPTHSHIEFSAKHLMVTTVKGNFREFSGEVEVDGEDPTTARGRFVIKTASLTTGTDDRDNHLRSADFFEAEKYPEMVFVSKTVEKAGEATYRVTGDLTIRDTTKPLTLGAIHESSRSGATPSNTANTTSGTMQINSRSLFSGKSL